MSIPATGAALPSRFVNSLPLRAGGVSTLPIFRPAPGDAFIAKPQNAVSRPPEGLTRGANWVRQATVLLGARRAQNFRHMEDIFPSRRIAPSTRPSPLHKQVGELPETFTYKGETKSVDTFLQASKTQGLLVMRGNTILAERAFMDASLESRFTSWSMSKSVTSLLLGIAIDQGLVGSVDDPVTRYVPELKNSGYATATLRDLLQMRSGAHFVENYENIISDIYWVWVKMYAFGQSLADYLSTLSHETAPGGAFVYRSSDTAVLGLVLTRATGKNLSTLLQEQLWEPLGMQGEAYWMTDKHGQELAFCGLNATLSDFARIGQLVAQGGRAGGQLGQQLVSKAWIDACITLSGDPALQPGTVDPNMGYQYQWWIPEGNHGEVMACGLYGQYIYIDVPRQIVIVKTSADPDSDDRDGETIALFRGLAEQAAHAPQT